MSAFWFEKTKHIIDNHVLEVPDPNVVVAKKAKPFLVEVVVRGYLTGVTDTAIWTNYQKGKRSFGGLTLPDGLEKNTKLPRPIITPTTKAGHDENLELGDIVPRGLASEGEWATMQKAALELFEFGQTHAASKGLILVDTKYEFGLHEGKIILIDEVHTPDNSRYWLKESYDEIFGEATTSDHTGSSPNASRSEASREPMAFDKEFLRIWFKENCDPYNDPVLPEAPPEMVEEMSRRYISLYEQIAGTTYEKFDGDIGKRISENLLHFKIS